MDLSVEQIAGLVAALMALMIAFRVLRNIRQYNSFLRHRLGGNKGSDGTGTRTKTPKKSYGGPWG